MYRNNNIPPNKNFNNLSEDEQKEIEFKSNPFKFQNQEPKPEEKSDNNSNDPFNKYFNRNIRNNVGQSDQMDNIHQNNPIKLEYPKKEQKDWDGQFLDLKINEISIPIPSFVQFSTIKQLFTVVEEVQKQVNDYLKSEQLKNQTLKIIHKDFIKKNENIIQKFSKKDPKNNEEEQKNNLDQEKNKQHININKNKPSFILKEDKQITPLDMHLKKENEQFNKKNKKQDNETKSTQSHKSKKSYSSEFNQVGLIQRYDIHNKQPLSGYWNDLYNFLTQKILKNQQNCFKVCYEIQQQIKQKEENESAKNKKPKNKYPCLYYQQDYSINQQQMQLILQTVDNFGVDKCQVQEKINSALKTKTISINFKENKVLKTISYSILYRFICEQEPQYAKKFIYKILGYINPNTKGSESENFILRQIFLHFLCILVSEVYYQSQTISFLNEIFAFEFISSLILDQLFYSATKLNKVNHPIDDINKQIDCLAKGNNLDLYLIDSRQNVKKCLFKREFDKQNSQIFIYFEQSLAQQQSQAVYFVINPNVQLLAFV